MGLDGVELIMAVEDEFQIAISDSDAEQCVTVGKLVNVVHARLRNSSSDPCLSQHGFYVVRKTLMDTLALKRSQIRPNTKLESLIPRPGRKDAWRKLITSLPASNDIVASLAGPAPLRLFMSLVLPALTWIAVARHTRIPALFALPIGILAAILGTIITRPLRQEFPSGLREVKDLIPFVSTLESKTWAEDDVFQRVQKMTADQFGIDESRITPKTDFVKDLGV